MRPITTGGDPIAAASSGRPGSTSRTELQARGLAVRQSQRQGILAEIRA